MKADADSEGLLVDAREFAGWAAHVVTRAYRAGLNNAKAVDAAHGNLVRRTGLRGTLAAGDDEVTTIIAAAIVLDEIDTARHKAERERLDRERAGDTVRRRVTTGPRVDPDLLARALEKLDGRPFIGDLQRERRQQP